SLASLKIINTLFARKLCPLFETCAWQTGAPLDIKPKTSAAATTLPGIRFDHAKKWLGQFKRNPACSSGPRFSRHNAHRRHDMRHAPKGSCRACHFRGRCQVPIHREFLKYMLSPLTESEKRAWKPRRQHTKNHCSSMKKDSRSPFIIEFVMVQGVGFVCMAYRDEKGKWRNAGSNDELPQPVRVLK
ncbi:MAG TPA: hypothetical protein VED19_01980, partial [Candidatus Nitrosopolaris sp.]|nr:hypothetical protein [Candidatus Nitrosopolaris sp.]